MNALNAFEGQGIEFTAAGDKLRYRAPEGVITDEIRESLKQHKAELLGLLRRREVWEFRLIKVGGDPWMVGTRLDKPNCWMWWFVRSEVSKQ